TPYTGSSATGNASYTPTGCANVPFSPEFTAKVGARGFTAPSTKPPITTSIRQTSDEAGLKDAIVFLPSVIGADLAALDANCPEAQFLAGTCPESTVIGSAIAETPLLTTPLAGPVIVVKGADPLPRLGLDLRGELPLKLSGEFVLTGGTGVSFSDLPDIPISNFELRFKANGLSVNSTNLCAPPAPVFSTDFTAHSGATQSGPSTATVDGCTSPKAPSAKVTVKGTRSGQPSLKLKAKAGSSKLRQVKLKLPKSLSFAGSGAFENGLKAQADGRKLPAGAVANGSRKLKVTLPRGASSLVVRIAKGALRSKGARGKLRFPVKLLDADGTRTALKLRAKAK
ncbi:MAG: hypothetical protein M3M99_05255, partial [Actinomycetota bacterium]|nr:hypothetical protein [Actinomycetota bacterium]